MPAAEIDALTTRCRELGARTLVSSVHAHALLPRRRQGADVRARRGHACGASREAEVAEHYAFVGDSPNDQAAFAFFAASIGVANVARYAAVLNPPPRYITPSPHGRGFAEAIDAILARRTQGA